MSGSSKKKLRNDNAAGKLTERQQYEQQEAKKLKLYTAAFAVVLVLLIAVAAYAGITNAIEASGVHQKNTVAATVGDHKLSSVDLSYYYMDAVNNFNSNYGTYAYMYGLDTSAPLDQQVYDPETGETWADNFIEQAAASAQAIYALADAAKAEGFTLPEDAQAQVTANGNNLDAYATIYGYENADAFLKAQYGNGASKASYMEYFERNMLAQAYQNAHQDSLNYDEAAIRAADKEDPAAYSSYSYNQYYLGTSRFLENGVTDDEGNVTYTAADRAAAAKKAEAVAKELTDAEAITSVDELNAAIAGLSINADTTASSTEYSSQRRTSINAYFADWVTDSARKAGDMTYVPVVSTTTDENGNEIENTTAYYIVFFRGSDDNKFGMANVRHILIGFTGETNEDGTYTDEAKAAAKATAEEILNEWKSGDATEESFAALATEKSTDTGSTANGGLYENVFPGQMVKAFNDWCFDASRKSGDTGIVETEYGYHVMYYVSTSEQTYRDYQITNALMNNDMNTWYDNLVSGYVPEIGDTQYIRKDIVLAR